MNKVRIGVAGAGGIALSAHLPWFRLHPGVRLAAVADVDEKKLRAVAAIFGVPRTYADAAEMFDSGEVDAVSICTPPWLHEEHVIHAAGRGLHILCEKPLAPDVERARRMLDAVSAAGIVFQVGFQKRFHDGFRKIRRIVADGQLGEITSAGVRWNFNYPDLDSPFYRGLARAADAAGINLREQMGLWRLTDPRAEGCTLMDFSIHFIDILRNIIGEPVEVACETNRVRPGRAHEDHSLLTLRFGNGAIASIETNLNVVGRMASEESGVIHGTKGSLRFQVPPINSLPPFRLSRYSKMNLLTNRWTPAPMPPGTEILQYKYQVDHFLGRIAGKIPPRLRDAEPDTGEDSLRTIGIIRAAYRSAAEGRKIKLEL